MLRLCVLMSLFLAGLFTQAKASAVGSDPANPSFYALPPLSKTLTPHLAPPRLTAVDNDPITFSLSGSKPQVAVGEDFELTITARFLNLPASQYFTFEGANGFALKLILPVGFEPTGGTFSDLVRGKLTAAYPTAQYTLRGRFTSRPEGEKGVFRLLRGNYESVEHSLFVEKVRLFLPVHANLARAREAGSGVSRQLLYNVHGGTQSSVHFAKRHYFTGISFWESWYRLNPAPGVYKWDSLRATLDLCRTLGLKAQVNFTLRRQRNTGGRPQDHEGFFPETDIMRYNDGSHFKYQPILDFYDVTPSFSSAQGLASIETFMRKAAEFLKPYYDDGTLLNVLSVTGQAGELTYPFDETPSKPRWTDYSAPSLNEYRTSYLPNRYGSIAALNQAWGTSYSGFEATPMPIAPTPTDIHPTINTESRRDWIRFGTKKITELAARCRNALRSVAPIPFHYFASELAHYYYSVPFRATNIPYMAATLDGIYTSAGSWNNGELAASKLAWVDIIKGTLGSNKTVEIEFDNDDLSSTFNAFDHADQVRGLGSRFFDKGGEYIHIMDLGDGFNWGAVDPHLQFLRDTYCKVPNNAPTPRSPQATGSYNWTKLISGEGQAPFDLWRSLNGSSRQVDIRCVDDFDIDRVSSTPPPGVPPPPPAAIAPVPVTSCVQSAVVVSESLFSGNESVLVKASFDGGINEPGVNYQWIRPDGTVSANQSYSFGTLSTAPRGTYVFKALRNEGAACLSITLSNDGLSITP